MPKFKGTTHIIAILDRSGSMQGLVGDTIGGYNSWLKKTKKAFKGQDVKLTLHLFDDRHEFPQVASELDDVPALDGETYFARGSTALLDAVGRSLNETKGQMAKGDRALALIVTDGYENASKEWSGPRIKKLIEKLEKSGDWTIDYLGANQDAFAVAQTYGMSMGTTTAASSAGTHALWHTNSARTASLASSDGTQMGNRSQADYDEALAKAEKEKPKSK